MSYSWLQTTASNCLRSLLFFLLLVSLILVSAQSCCRHNFQLLNLTIKESFSVFFTVLVSTSITDPVSTTDSDFFTVYFSLHCFYVAFRFLCLLYQYKSWICWNCSLESFSISSSKMINCFVQLFQTWRVFLYFYCIFSDLSGFRNLVSSFGIQQSCFVFIFGLFFVLVL